jgi:hypothetical protein
VLAHLNRFRLKLAADLAAEIGADDAATIAAAMVKAAMGRKHELEAASAGRA